MCKIEDFVSQEQWMTVFLNNILHSQRVFWTQAPKASKVVYCKPKCKYFCCYKKIMKYFVISHIWTKRDKKSLKFLLAHSKRKAYHLWWTLKSFENDAIEYNLDPVDKDEEEIRQMQKLLNLTVHQMPSSLMVDSVILGIYGSWSSVSPKGCELQDREQAINRRRRNKWSKKLIFVNLFVTFLPFELKKKKG